MPRNLILLNMRDMLALVTDAALQRKCAIIAKFGIVVA